MKIESLRGKWDVLEIKPSVCLIQVYPALIKVTVFENNMDLTLMGFYTIKRLCKQIRKIKLTKKLIELGYEYRFTESSEKETIENFRYFLNQYFSKHYSKTHELHHVQ